MDQNVPYMPTTGKLHAILAGIQNAGAPEAFGIDFLKDLGFTSSNDRSVIKLLKYLGFLDSSGRPQQAYREFMDGSQAKLVLARQLRKTYDDLFLSDKDAHTKSVEKLKGWFKTKTGSGDAVSEKMARTFKSLASYADFSQNTAETADVKVPPSSTGKHEEDGETGNKIDRHKRKDSNLSFAYRIEIQLPDTTNVDTYRAIFKALREELE
jgi:hypothetical protein